MKPHGLTQLVHAPDLDYVAGFQALAAANLELHEKGPTPQRLVRKAMLEMDVGSFSAARKAAEQALRIDEDCAEAHFQRGVACTLQALVKASVLPGGPGRADLPLETLRQLLSEAGASFAQALRCNPGDVESLENVEAMGDILDAASSEVVLAALLRGDSLAPS